MSASIDMAEHAKRQVVEEQVQHSVALMDTQGAIRGTIREIIAYAAGTRENSDKLSNLRHQKAYLSHAQKERDTVRVANGREELGSAHLDVGSERARTAVLLTEITNALDGQCALDPDAAFMVPSCGPNRRPNPRQRRCQWQVGVPTLAADDGCCDTMAELMTLHDKVSQENARLCAEIHNMTEERDEVKARCADYVREMTVSMNTLQQELDQLRTDSETMQHMHKEQLMQRQQLHEGETAQLQEEVDALQIQHAEDTANLRAQIDRDQAVRARQDEELTILRALQEREEAFLQAVSGLKTQAEQGVAPAVEETQLSQARMHDALKQAELARNEQASLLQALQAQVSAVHKELSNSMEQNAAQKNQVSSLEEQLKQAQAELHATKNSDAAAEQHRLFAEQQRWIVEQLKGLAGAVQPPVVRPSSGAPPQQYDDTEIPNAPEDPPDYGPAQQMSPQRSSQMFLSDEEPPRIDAVYRSVGRLAETLRDERHQSEAKGAASQQPDAATGTQSEKQSGGGRKRKRSEKQNSELAHPAQETADVGGDTADAGDEDTMAGVAGTSAGILHAPTDSEGERDVHDQQQPSRKMRDRGKSSAGPSEPACTGVLHEEPAPLARGRRRSNRAAAAGLQRCDLPRVAEDEDLQHRPDGMGFGCDMPPGGEHGSPPVPFGRDAAQQGPQGGGGAFEIWEDPASVSPLPPTLRHDGAHVGLARALVNTSNQTARTQTDPAASAQDSRASARKSSAAPRSHKDPSAFGIVRNPSAAITSKVLQAATASRQNFRSFSWADKLAATASERVQQRKGQFTKKRGSQLARLGGKIEQPPVKDLFPSGLRLASVRR